MIGADEAVRARSNRDLGRFLDGVFGGDGGARGMAPASARGR